MEGNDFNSNKFDKLNTQTADIMNKSYSYDIFESMFIDKVFKLLYSQILYLI
jgi:hypothetical protein